MPTLRLNAILGLVKTGFDAGMADANKQVSRFGSGLKSQLMGALGAAGFLKLAKDAIEYGDSMDELAERLSVTRQQAQLYSIAARLGGADSEFFAMKFEKLRKAMSGDSGLLDIFNIKAGGPVEALQALADKIQTTGLNAEQATKFVEIFGKGSGRLINVLGDLKNAGQGTALLSDKDIEKLKRADDLFVKMGHNLKVLGSMLFVGPSDISDSWFGKLLGLKQASGGAKTKLDEGGFVDRQEAVEEAAKAHMATQDRILRIEKESAEISERTRVSQLSQDERRNELIAEREKLFSTIAKTEEERFQKELDLKKNEAEIVAIAVKKNKHGRSRIEDSALGSIGAFTGGNTQANGQMQVFQTLKEIRDAMVVKGIIVRDTR